MTHDRDPSTGCTQALAQIIDVLVDAVMIINAEHKILFANQATSRLFGYAPDELQGLNLHALIPERLRERHTQGMARYLAAGGQRSSASEYVRVQGLRKDGTEIPMSLSMTHTFQDRQPVVTGVLRDMQELVAAQLEVEQRMLELERLNTELAAQAERDPMTGALNRRALARLLDELWAAEVPNEVSVALCDIDHFKAYNDHYGHLAGDQCLTAVAEALSREVRARSGHLVRFGGEEFLAVLPGVSRAESLSAAEAMRLAVLSCGLPHAASATLDRVSLSVGIATGGTGDVAAKDLIRHADDALYFAKRYRNRVHAWEASQTE
jgi:diguanylate cyclase (GGDEF)-like protein/PAS domain S-box-containing protein